ncbi:MAG: MmgE/PrpD family protein [Pseudomonadota bacterium]
MAGHHGDTTTVEVAEYIAEALSRPLPGEVSAKTTAHILDTLAAILSGGALAAGRAGAEIVTRLGGPEEALAIVPGLVTGAPTAALANGMAAHADETDDSHAEGRFHPGCSIVPAALAMAEREGRSGSDLVRAVALGYDIGARAVMALGVTSPRTARFSTHSIGGNFGSTAAASALAGLDARQAEWALSYAVQQAGGVPYWRLDHDHIEKAYDFGGMSARAGVTAALLVQAGWTGVTGTLTGPVSFLSAFAQDPKPNELTAGLGARFEIMQAGIKKYCTGMPVQAAIEALSVLMAEHGIRADNVAQLTATMPDDRIQIVDNAAMPDVCLQYLLAVTLLDGGLGFAAAHDHARMNDKQIQELRARIIAEPSAELTEARPPRQAIVTVETTDGRVLRHHTRAVLGTPANPMTGDQVADKARDLIEPVLGPDRTARLVETVRALDTVADVRELRPLLAPRG